jgi:hypothetical protein
MRVLDTVIYTVPGDLFVTLSTSDKGLFKTSENRSKRTIRVFSIDIA